MTGMCANVEVFSAIWWFIIKCISRLCQKKYSCIGALLVGEIMFKDLIPQYQLKHFKGQEPLSLIKWNWMKNGIFKRIFGIIFLCKRNAGLVYALYIILQTTTPWWRDGEKQILWNYKVLYKLYFTFGTKLLY